MTTKQKIIISDYLKEIYRQVTEYSGAKFSTPIFKLAEKNESELLSIIGELEKEIANEEECNGKIFE